MVKLGLEDRIVGTSSFCRIYLRNRSNKEVVGSYLTVNWEKLRKLRPDLVLVGGGVQEPLHHELLNNEYNTILLPHPGSVMEIFQNVLAVGLLTGSYDEASNLVKEYVSRLKEIRNTHHGTLPTVYVELFFGDDDVVTTGRLTYVDDLLRFSGGANLYRDEPVAFFRPDFDDVRDKDPDILIFSVKPGVRFNANEVVAKRGWTDMEAVRTRRLLVIYEGVDVNLASPGPSVVTTVEWLSRRLRGLHETHGRVSCNLSHAH